MKKITPIFAITYNKLLFRLQLHFSVITNLILNVMFIIYVCRTTELLNRYIDRGGTTRQFEAVNKKRSISILRHVYPLIRGEADKVPIVIFKSKQKSIDYSTSVLKIKP